MSQLACGVSGIDRHRDEAGPQHPEEDRGELGHVGQRDHDARAAVPIGGQAERGEVGGDGVDLPVQLGPGDHRVV
jgi:hypothetical protein